MFPPDMCIDDGTGQDTGYCLNGGTCAKVSPAEVSPNLDRMDPEYIFRPPPNGLVDGIARDPGDCPDGSSPRLGNSLNAGNMKVLGPNGFRGYAAEFVYRVSDDARGDFVIAIEGISNPPMGDDGTRFTGPGSPGPLIPLTPFSAMVHVPGCANDVECGDRDACTCDRCVGGMCTNVPTEFGNVDCAGEVDLDDVICVLEGFAVVAACPNGDVTPGCTGNGIIDVDDILATLDGVAGVDPCECP